jgi:NarL family two-component system response regulator LiaR
MSALQSDRIAAEDLGSAFSVGSAGAQPAIRVLVVDDHPIVRRGIRAMLLGAPGIEWVGEAEDGLDAIREIARVQPDVVLMDLLMPGMDGSRATEAITREHPDVRVLVLTSVTDPESLAAAEAAGAVGIIGKDGNSDAVISGIRAASAWSGPATPGPAQDR